MTLFRATVLDTPDDPFTGGALRADDDCGLLVEDGVVTSRGPFGAVRREHPDAEVLDLREGLLLPGLVDTHVHFPQVRVIGGLGMPLLDWLERCALPEELRLADLLDRPHGKLSAGQKTRVSLAKALLNEPELLLLDEPTASLDPDTADWVRTRLEHYRRARGATVVLASHNMAEVERLADRVIMLEKGRIVADGTPQELIDRFGRTNLEETFLAIARRGASDAELQP